MRCVLGRSRTVDVGARIMSDRAITRETKHIICCLKAATRRQVLPSSSGTGYPRWTPKCSMRTAATSNSSSTEMPWKQPQLLRVLGIETSCDDSAVGVVDSNHNIIAQCARSQLSLHNKFGGIIPPLAGKLHVTNVRTALAETLTKLSAHGLSLTDMDAIAVTNRPGLLHSLESGINFARELCRTYDIPMIPVHHMEAHALTARLVRPDIKFPFLTLLLSGGHGLLALVRGVHDYVLLGSTGDNAPGEALDKIARRLNIINFEECAGMSGGRAVEYFASKPDADIKRFDLPLVMTRRKDCDFSFSGILFSAEKQIKKLEKEYDIGPGERIPYLNDLCAAVLYAMARTIARRIERAFLFCDRYVDETTQQPLMPLIDGETPSQHKNFLVMSGGVAANSYIKNFVSAMCDKYGYELVAPPPSLCTDNGVMIAWNGIERIMHGGLAAEAITTRQPEFDKVYAQWRVPFGDDWRDRVARMNIRANNYKFSDLLNAVQKKQMQEQQQTQLDKADVAA